MEEHDIDVTPFFYELGRYTFSHIGRFLLYMALVAIGASAAFLYVSHKEQREISLEKGDDDGDS